MSIHYGNNEYYHLVGKVLVDQNNVCRVIQGIREERDNIYNMTDGHAGNAYRVYLMATGSDEMESLHFRHFKEVVRKYGELQPDKQEASLTVKKTSSPKSAKWAKIHPEEEEIVVAGNPGEKLTTLDDLQ
jgi:hypothetical protein